MRCACRSSRACATPPLHRHEAEPRDLFTSASNGRSHSLDEDDQRPTKISILNCPEGVGQPKRPRVSEQVLQRRRLGVGAAVDACKKRRRRNFENLRNPNEPAATDAVRTRLVFLDLLEGDANASAELACDNPFAMRRMRTLRATTRSTEWGALGGIIRLKTVNPHNRRP
jgi:hypothetical protein